MLRILVNCIECLLRSVIRISKHEVPMTFTLLQVFMFLRVCILILAVISVITAQYPCPVDTPCNCDGRSINCDSRNLTSIPHFSITNGTFWSVDLSNNAIRNIPSKAFVNLKGMYLLNIMDNQIVQIADDALEGSENSLSFIFMRNNRVKELPKVIGKMKALSSLGIDGNPLQTLDSNVLRAIGSKLQYLAFGSPELTKWPAGVKYLTNLISLAFRNSPMQELPADAFLGLDKVGLFGIDNCQIKYIPISLSFMSSLEILSLNNDPDLPLSGIPSEAFSGMLSLQSLIIKNQQYDTLPDIFHDTIALNKIEVSMTPVKRIPASLFPDDTTITELNFNDTRLDHIPEAISKMNKLKRITIKYSNITNISSSDFRGLIHLIFLGISYTPLTEIADDALADMNSLVGLSLDNTNITTVPRALSKLKNPQNLKAGVSLENNKIICNCENLSWLKDWKGTDMIQIIGKCTNLNIDIRTYILREIPHCRSTNSEMNL